MGKREVWAVTEGEFDTVRYLFETEEEAKKAVENGVGDSMQSFTLFTDGEHPQLLIIWHTATVIREGHTESRTWSDTDLYFAYLDTPATTQAWAQRYVPWSKDSDVRVSAYGTDREAVERAVSDKVEELMNGGTDE